MRWLFAAGQPVRSSPAVVDDTLYVGSGRTLYAIATDSGEARWSYPTGGTIVTSPAVTGGVVYIGSHDGFLYAIAGSEDELDPPAGS